MEKVKKPSEGLTDEHLMPYGTYKGTKMKDVPASYLLWCRREGRATKAVIAYVTDNLRALELRAMGGG